ncbi:VCBS repeat-containing protein [Moorena sp. SIO4G3]|uniref:FG-GAP repeat domain-containing protein n=1 Tax=Moorena sp. SIO4G3 TaxID=2607821 RepID=UPI001429B0BF|nr:VCBS repeat-containing protein [Moorena sp. SIO4G3]NEO78677.1 VCBS repeat-containing protein [Moorena sp. SIO4G3]
MGKIIQAEDILKENLNDPNKDQKKYIFENQTGGVDVIINGEIVKKQGVKIDISGIQNINNVINGTEAPPEGVLTFDWKKEYGLPGKYDIGIAYFDEADGESELTFKVNGQEVGTYVYDLNLIGNNTERPTAEAKTYVPLEGDNSADTLSNEDNPNPIFKNIDLAPGDQIEISALAHSNGQFPPKEEDVRTFELGRIDEIEFTRAPSVDLFWHNPESAENQTVEFWTLTEQYTEDEQTKLMKDQHFIKDSPEKLVPDNAGLEAYGVIDLGDGNRSPLWRDNVTGAVSVWKMKGSEFEKEIIIDSLPGGPKLDWEIRGTGDVNRDGAEEIFWYNTSTGDIGVWEIDENGLQNAKNITKTNGENMIEAPDKAWKLVAAGDMDNDGDADAIWQHKQDKTFAYWELEGTVFQKEVELKFDQGDGPWEFRGAYDTYGDGFNDFYFLSGDGETAIWMIDENPLNGNIVREDIVLMDTFEDTNFSFYV